MIFKKFILFGITFAKLFSVSFLKKAADIWRIDWQNALSNVSFVENPFNPRERTFIDLIPAAVNNFDREENSKVMLKRSFHFPG